MAMCLLMFLKTLWCFFPQTKSLGSVCILYIPFAVQCSFLSLLRTTEAKHHIKTMKGNDYSHSSEKKLILYFFNQHVE